MNKCTKRVTNQIPNVPNVYIFPHIEYTTEDAADNFKTLARRNGIKVSSPGKETGATAGMQLGKISLC